MPCGRAPQTATGPSPLETRNLAQQTVLAGIDRQYDYLSDLDRAQIYASLRHLPSLDDLSYRLAALRRLTKDGRDLAGLETNLVTVLLAWLSQLTALDGARRRARQQDLTAVLAYLMSLVKFSLVLLKVWGKDTWIGGRASERASGRARERERE